MQSRDRHKELRCGCSRKPLLATYGLDLDGKLYIHVKVYKQGRIFGEIVVTNGTVRLRCRECYRWQRIFIRQDGPVLRQDQAMEESFPALTRD